MSEGGEGPRGRGEGGAQGRSRCHAREPAHRNINKPFLFGSSDRLIVPDRATFLAEESCARQPERTSAKKTARKVVRFNARRVEQERKEGRSV